MAAAERKHAQRMTQIDLEFHGKTYNPALDRERLTRALDLVLEALRSGGWWTLHHLAGYAKCSEAGASARLRDLRRKQHGSHLIGRRRVSGGALFEYKLMDPTPDYGKAA